VQQYSDQPGDALVGFAANPTTEDAKQQLKVRWGYAVQGISATRRQEEGDERPRGRRTGWPMKNPMTTIVLLLALVAGCALEMFVLGQLGELGRMRVLLL
jgi:hypothetical protein